MCMSWVQLRVGDIVIQNVRMGVSEIVIAIVNLKILIMSDIVNLV